jgi:hypothetical protein
MTKRPRPAINSVTATANVPVRVKLKRLNCDFAKPYPPDGLPREWWQRLKQAFGTASSAFVNASLAQLIAAARLSCSGISEIAVNASLAFIEGAKPRDEVECALVIQLVECRSGHSNVCRVLHDAVFRKQHPHRTDRLDGREARRSIVE